jgi:LacI family transcriptional regulator
MGYRNPVHFAGPGNINIYEQRLKGFRDTLEKHGLAPGFVIEKVLLREEGYRETEKLLGSGRNFDAIFASSDFSAHGAMECLQDNGFKIPEEVGLAGFANEPFTELIGLSTVDQKSTELGRTAARLLFEGIDEARSTASKKIEIKPEMIIRNSTLRNKTYEIY